MSFARKQSGSNISPSLNIIHFLFGFREFDHLTVVGRRADPHPCVIPRNLSHCASKPADGESGKKIKIKRKISPLWLLNCLNKLWISSVNMRSDRLLKYQIKLVLNSFQNHVKNECQFSIVSCPNNCGATDMKASQVSCSVTLTLESSSEYVCITTNQPHTKVKTLITIKLSNSVQSHCHSYPNLIPNPTIFCHVPTSLTNCFQCTSSEHCTAPL